MCFAENALNSSFLNGESHGETSTTTTAITQTRTHVMTETVVTEASGKYTVVAPPVSTEAGVALQTTAVLYQPPAPSSIIHRSGPCHTSTCPVTGDQSTITNTSSSLDHSSTPTLSATSTTSVFCWDAGLQTALPCSTSATEYYPGATTLTSGAHGNRGPHVLGGIFTTVRDLFGMGVLFLMDGMKLLMALGTFSVFFLFVVGHL